MASPKTAELTRSELSPINEMTSGFWGPSHFIQFFSLWQQIRWIRDYLGTNNSLRDVTNLSLILFTTTTSGSVIGSSSRKKTNFCCLGTALAAKMVQWSIRPMWNGFQISIEQSHCWADDGAIRLVTDWDYTSVLSRKIISSGRVEWDNTWGWITLTLWNLKGGVGLSPLTVRGPRGLLFNSFLTPDLAL